jgi:hypothetical protein
MMGRYPGSQRYGVRFLRDKIDRILHTKCLYEIREHQVQEDTIVGGIGAASVASTDRPDGSSKPFELWG